MSHDELRHELRSLLGAARALVEIHRGAGAAGLPVEAPTAWPPQVDDLLVGLTGSPIRSLTPGPSPASGEGSAASEASPPAPLHVRGEGSAERAPEASSSAGVDSSLPLSTKLERGPGGEASELTAPPFGITALPPQAGPVPSVEPPPVVAAAPVEEAPPAAVMAPVEAAQPSGEPATLAATLAPLLMAEPGASEVASFFEGEPTQGHFPGLTEGLDEPKPRPDRGQGGELPPPRTEAAHRHLVVLAERISQCTACELHKSRTRTVFARGNPDADVCFVGEAPGPIEDEQGLPFVSPAGQLLDRMIAAMGLSQDEVYVTTLCRCRPPGDRAPTTEEMATCMPFLREQLAVTRPRVIVALGATATKGLLQTSLGIRALRGTWKLYRTTPLMPTYHPAYLLRETEAGRLDAKREVWKDLQAVLERMGRSLPSRGKS